MDNQTEEKTYVGFAPASDGDFIDDDIDNLRLQLDEVEQELRQAAKYGLHLVAKNSDLIQSMERIHIAHEMAVSELKGEITTLERLLHAMQLDRDAWKRRCHTTEEALDRLQQDRDHAPSHSKGADTHQLIQSRNTQAEVDRLTSALHDATVALQDAMATAVEKDAVIHRLQSTKRDMLDIIQQMKCAAANDASVRKALASKNATLHSRLAAAMAKVEMYHEAFQERLADEDRLRNTIEELTLELQTQGDHVEAKSNLMHSMMVKCNRLERELEALVGRDSTSLPQNNAGVENKDDYATPMLSTEDRTALASFDRLENFFKLTALGIILDHGAHDKLLQGSSRHTIQAWFREAMANDVPYHQWHRWLTIRIAAASPHDGFRFFRPRKSLSVEIPPPSSSPSSLASAISDFFDKYKRKSDPTVPE
ncbi:hypothetical protein, variant [Aphanomyces invadans]|uniref:Uncharacterized protein n=1 Tax=Aphanomyces invadans TaxID=157072 RepID=A0A024UVJ5_9STRA|nr:hypothetical protein, variant [Aphanomyces invadans]ETW10369.1 hypothetical protein, variant [Aphanomyces invadans]|eukprot:XP_008861780.1 hypothetical protein, variant [Aphanomyces invadans]